jgi:hypothetical protein
MTGIVDKELYVLVEGGKMASGVYKWTGIVDEVGSYATDGQEFTMYRYDNRGVKIWHIVHKKSNSTWYTALASGDEPDRPPSQGWREKRENTCAMTGEFGNQKVLIGASREFPAPITKVTVLSVRKPCATTYMGILFSEEYSDATIICEDEVVIPVHKNILAASSPYFKAAFSGDWAENQSGVIKTSYPAHIIKETLSLIYTGDSTTNIIQESPLDFISVASEFDLPWLKTLVEPICVESLDGNNLKGMWQTSRMYGSEMLKTACVNYTKKNAVPVLTNSTVIDLKNEDPASWKEFAFAVGSD